ncbi:MAG TPA: ATP-binding protein [Verrucomicrobiae bacterium]|nr:ATP-binding protein [Verrucomicrobiae bacterium]
MALGLGFAYTATGQQMKRIIANQTAVGTIVALSVLILVGLLAYNRLSELAGALVLLSSGLVAAVIHREAKARQRAERELRQSNEELERRVAARLVEINTANVALQAEVLERQRAEDALRIAHDDLEKRVTDRTRELADANHVLRGEIEARKKTAEALRDSRALYHSLVEQLPVHVWRTDAAGKYIFVNAHLADSFRLTEEEVRNKGVADFYTQATAEKFMADDRRVLEGDASVEVIHAYETNTGKEGFLQMVKTPLVDAESRIVGVQGISWDVTERVRAEEEMRRIQAQIERTNQDLMRKNDEIQNFYHTLSHELKTPLTSAREFISIVMDGLAGSLNPTQLEYLGIARESCNQLRVCINDLLDATRLETGKLSLEQKPDSLAFIVQRVVSTLQPAAQGKNIELTCEAEPDLDTVMVDAYRIAQVVTNLLNNALKFTREEGQISVHVGESPESAGWAEVVVKDTGCGIPEEQQDRIFDRLYQVMTGDAATENGVGLGLYICRELVRLHGGEITVQSTPGVGSTFTFTLPFARTAHDSNLLLVEDDPAMRDILRKVLERERFSVVTAGDGQEALESIRRHLPDVILMDLEMPGMDGSSALEQIRRLWGSVPVILHTGHVTGELMDRAMQYSPAMVLSKPCPMEQIVHTVRSVQPAGSDDKGTVIRAGTVETQATGKS